VSFAKLLGTGRGREFGPTGGVDPCRWAALTVWHGPPHPITGFDRIAGAHCRLTLRPLASRGRWSGHAPFGEPAADIDTTTPTAASAPHDGPLLVLTRARLRPAGAPAFWRAIGPVAATLATAPGLLTAFGIGEAPLGFQGTVSIWAGAPDIRRFAYRTAEHATVVEATPVRRWYAEELFARLAVLEVTGDREVIGWNGEQG
jgi:hypothetical protein